MIRRGFSRAPILFFGAAILCAFPVICFSQNREVSDEEYRVFDAVIASKFNDGGTDFGSLSDGRILVIQDRTTDNSGLSEEWDYIRERIRPSAEAFSDYKAMREKTARLSRKFSTKSEYIFFSPEDREKIFKPGGSYDDLDAGWKRYYGKYPKSRGYIGFSRVGFNNAKTEALLFFEHSCGSLCASGYYISLWKRTDGWTVKHSVMIWIS